MGIPVDLTASLGAMKAPVLSIYFRGDTPDVTIIGGTTLRLVDGSETHDILLSGKSTTELAAAVAKTSLPYEARVLLDVDDVGAIGLFKQASDTTCDGGIILRANGHVVKELEDTRIHLLPPYGAGHHEPWYVVVNRGYVTGRAYGSDWKFAVPEYERQTWSTRYGRGFIDVEDETVERSGPRVIKLARTPVMWDKGNIFLTVRGLQQPGFAIQDVDVNNGIVYLTRDYDDGENVLASYTYQEDGYIYPGIDLNPSEFHNPAILDRYVLFYLLPYIGPGGILRTSCVQHVVANTLFGAIQPIPKTNEPVLILGAAQVRQAHEKKDVQLTDTRVRGGGIKDEQEKAALGRSREILSAADLGFFDGKPYPGGQALFVRLPKELLETLQRAEIEGVVRKFTAYGTYTMLEFE